MNDDEKEFTAICNKMRAYTDALAEMRARGIVDERFDKLCQQFIEWGEWAQPRLIELDKKLQNKENGEIAANNRKAEGNDRQRPGE